MTDPARRPGKRSDLDVPVALVEAAERMFGEASVESVSLRAVARAAGVAPAAVFYHYPTKDDLVGAVVARRGRTVGRQTRQDLAALAERAEVSVRDVVEAVLMPMVAEINADPEGGLNWAKVVAWAATTDISPFHSAIEVAPSIDSLFVAALERALGRTRNPEIRRRTGIAVFGMLNALAGADRRGYGHPMTEDGLDPDFVEAIASFATAGLAAIDD
ncbi:TetR family transcriptional regulator [Nocardioides massiliensis]|uniref:AcrR family transcriptional regulator n=1 Tax=Nocardioides massiliensis TaxID=1325935 RepID=A0ABT9NJ48_9ACTN|nr:TetR family transcriptional regulator [Nocardioides massiliensis]MDP9820444.1 AcrR family transcriptional regulator [Nocardioides massiliensis]